VHCVLSFTHEILKPITALAIGTYADKIFLPKMGKKWQILETLSDILI
jgi:hypothetical protein